MLHSLFGFPSNIVRRRSGVVTPLEMDRYWKHLDLYYVTEESDDPDNSNGIVEHKIQW